MALIIAMAPWFILPSFSLGFLLCTLLKPGGYDAMIASVSLLAERRRGNRYQTALQHIASLQCIDDPDCIHCFAANALRRYDELS